MCVCRTESVAEKMLTNWFTFLLYKFLKVTFPLHYSHNEDDVGGVRIYGHFTELSDASTWNY